MKNTIIKLSLLALFLSGTVAFADQYDLAYKSFPGEAPTLAIASRASGDYIPLWDQSANQIVKVDATTFATSAGPYNGTLGATTPATAAVTSLTTTLGVVHTRTPAADSATTNNGSKVVLTTPVDTTGTNTHNAYDIAITEGNATGGTNTVNGIKFENVTGDAQNNTNAINIGTGTTLGTSDAIVIGSGWDAGIVTDSGVQIGSTNGTLVTSEIIASDAVANGQTAKTTTVTGATASSKCFASPTGIPTNSVFIKAAVAGTNQVVVTASGDPGAATLPYNVICYN